MTSRPNVVLMISDQHQAAVSGCYGHPLVQTGHIDRLASRGLRFERAYCQSPICTPSRASLLSGTHVHTCRAWSGRRAEPFVREMPTLASVLREAGYATGSFGKVHIVGEDRDRYDLGFSERGLRYGTYARADYIAAVGRDNVERYAPAGGADPARSSYINPRNLPVDLDESLMFDHLVVDRSLRFLQEHRDEPFLLWVGLEKPHPDWYVPARFHDLYDPRRIALPETLGHVPRGLPAITWKKLREAGELSEDEIRRCIAAYYAAVSYADHSVGRVLDGLHRLGLDDNTIVVYTADHGELLFEHGMTQKHCFFEPAVRVPLILAGPGVPGGQSREHIVSLLDLFPTLARACGVEPPEGVEGEPLDGVITGTAPVGGRRAFSEFYSFGVSERMVRTDDWKYVHSDGLGAQLYDLGADPLEMVNLADDPRHGATRARLEAMVLDGWEIPDPARIARPDLAAL